MAPSISQISHEQKIVLSFAKMLKQAYTGDVEFVFRNGGQGEDGVPLKLYAFRHILEGMDNGSPALDFSCMSFPPRFFGWMG
jgi:hypothetical protein